MLKFEEHIRNLKGAFLGKERGLQEVRVSTLILSSAYGSEVWKIFWRKIIKY